MKRLNTEHFASWWIYLVGATCGLLAVGEIDYSLLFYPVYAVVSTMAIVGAIYLGKKNLEI